MQNSVDSQKQQVREILSNWSPLFALANIDKKYYRLPEKDVDLELWADALTWLQEVATPVFQAWRQIRKQQTEDRWAWYARDPGMFRGFRETVIHEKALREARKLWISIKRPQLFRIRIRKTKGEKNV